MVLLGLDSLVRLNSRCKELGTQIHATVLLTCFKELWVAVRDDIRLREFVYNHIYYQIFPAFLRAISVKR